MRTRVKICGITRRQDAEFSIEQGADALGLVFYEPSPRAVTIAQAQQIITNLPPFVTLVGLFVNAESEFIRACISDLPLGMLQFHGDEETAFCEQFPLPYMKAIRMREEVDLEAEAVRFHSASALLLDSYQAGIPGGTGRVFDWSRIRRINRPIVLAGGLNPDNVAHAIEQVRPYAVDVSGGVEQAKGIKDKQKISDFMQEVMHG